MWTLIVATMCAGLFAGAAIYINAVEHPARLSCGSELAIREFAPSYHRATVMQGSLAVTGCVAGLWAAWRQADLWLALAAILLGAVVPFTLVVILPTNKQLLDPNLDPGSTTAAELLTRWGRLHAARSALSSGAFVLFLMRLGGQVAVSLVLLELPVVDAHLRDLCAAVTGTSYW
jgi:hypothetical protein